jgi:hypothetical protein
LSTIKESNPGTIVEWTCKGNLDDSTMIFGRVFWSFGSCVESFEYCKPLISVDDTPLHERYDEKLLIVVTFDANIELFPLAFAIINKKIIIIRDDFCFAYKDMLLVIDHVYV